MFNFVSELVSFEGEKNFPLCPQNRMLFKISDEHPFLFYMSPPWIHTGFHCFMEITEIFQDYSETQLVRQSQIVQSVMQDYQYDWSHLLPVCNLLVQGPKITYNYCLSRRF